MDTHAVFWLAQVPEELSPRAHSAVQTERERGGLAISSQTLWELSWMITRGRVGLRTQLIDFLREVERNFVVFPVTSSIAVRAVQFSDKYPRDPSDRLIGATAAVHGMQLLTKDEAIRASGEVDCIW